MADMTSAHAVISGRVQGVYFRMETRTAAERYNVLGWVRNKSDGTVEAVFEGDKSAVDAVLNWCRKGPPMSHVFDVDVTWGDYSGSFDSFDIRY